MNKQKKIIIFTATLVTVSCIFTTGLLAQGPGLPDPPVDAPLDGGITLVAAAAIGYGAKKLHKLRQNRIK